MKTKLTPFIGTWIIVEMGAWDKRHVTTEVQAYDTFKKDGTGHFQFGWVQGDMDCRIEILDGREGIGFSWEGQDEMDSASGRGWAVIENDELCGRIFMHQGDDSAFRARRS
jgi:hypothetical protein